jgi:hypothetical protein
MTPRHCVPFPSTFPLPEPVLLLALLQQVDLRRFSSAALPRGRPLPMIALVMPCYSTTPSSYVAPCFEKLP